MIPKKLHFVWIGNESKRPNDCIQTWIDKNPDYEVRIWGNEDLKATKWFNARHMMEMAKHELCGVADMMRYEILYNEGGITLDADSVCLAPLEDWLLKPKAFAHWEQEHRRTGLINVSVMGAEKNNEFYGQCIEDIKKKETVVDKRAWTNGDARYPTAAQGLCIWRSCRWPVVCAQEASCTGQRSTLLSVVSYHTASNSCLRLGPL